MTLLVVEDNTDVRMALARASSSLFDEVLQASTGLEALTIIEQEKPRVVITDWDLRGELSGIDVANYSQSLSSTTKVILITGKRMTCLKDQTRHLKIEFYLSKPFSVLELREVLHRCVQHH